MKAILFDLDGVFYTGDTAIPGALETIAWIKRKSIPHLFVTNTSSRPRSALVEKLAGMSIETDVEHIFTPLIATKTWLHSSVISNNLALYIPEKSKSEFSDFSEDYENPQAIIVGDLGEQWDYQKLNQIFRLLMANPELPLIALGMTRYWQADDGLRLDVAPFIKALEFASNRQAIVMGKPDQHFFQTALAKLSLPAEEVLMIGDDIRGDIDGAQQSGLQAWLVKTGKFRQSDLETGIEPERVIESIGDLEVYW